MDVGSTLMMKGSYTTSGQNRQAGAGWRVPLTPNVRAFVWTPLAAVTSKQRCKLSSTKQNAFPRGAWQLLCLVLRKNIWSNLGIEVRCLPMRLALRKQLLLIKFEVGTPACNAAWTTPASRSGKRARRSDRLPCPTWGNTAQPSLRKRLKALAPQVRCQNTLMVQSLGATQGERRARPGGLPVQKGLPPTHCQQDQHLPDTPKPCSSSNSAKPWPECRSAQNDPELQS